jgi:hypothetical protein
MLPQSSQQSDRLYHRAVIGERLREFGLTASLAMRALDVRYILEWLDSPEYSETCRLAEVDVDKVTAKFHQLIAEGNARNVQSAEL